jgi:hypothetical protein
MAISLPEHGRGDPLENSRGPHYFVWTHRGFAIYLHDIEDNIKPASQKAYRTRTRKIQSQLVSFLPGAYLDIHQYDRPDLFLHRNFYRSAKLPTIDVPGSRVDGVRSTHLSGGESPPER